jgi:hypothetical protein
MKDVVFELVSTHETAEKGTTFSILYHKDLKVGDHMVFDGVKFLVVGEEFYTHLNCRRPGSLLVKKVEDL